MSVTSSVLFCFFFFYFFFFLQIGVKMIFILVEKESNPMS